MIMGYFAFETSLMIHLHPNFDFILSVFYTALYILKCSFPHGDFDDTNMYIVYVSKRVPGSRKNHDYCLYNHDRSASFTSKIVVRYRVCLRFGHKLQKCTIRALIIVFIVRNPGRNPPGRTRSIWNGS